MVFQTGDRVVKADGTGGTMLVILASTKWVQVQYEDDSIEPLQRKQDVLKPELLVEYKGGPGSGRRPGGGSQPASSGLSTDHLAANSEAATMVHALRNTLVPAEPLTRTAIAASETAHNATRSGVTSVAQDRHSLAGIAHMNAATAIAKDHSIPNNRHTANLHERAAEAHMNAAQALQKKP